MSNVFPRVSLVPDDHVSKAPEAPSIWIDDGDWDEAAIPQRPWVAPGFLLKRAVTLLTGPPSGLKSSLMLGWAASLALNEQYGKFRPAISGPVIVYNVEDDQMEQQRRLSAVLRQFDATPAEIRGTVIRVGPNQVGTLITRDDDTGKLVLTPAMEEIEKLIKERKPVAFFADPLAELHEVEENDNTALRGIVARFRELSVKYDIAVCLAHHTRKGSANSAGDPDSARGASSLIGAVRIAFTLTGMSEVDAKDLGMPTDRVARSHYVRLDSAKSNYAALDDAVWFEKVAHELANGERVPAAEPWTPPAQKIASQTDLAAIVAAIKRGAPAAGGEPYSPKLSTDSRSIRTLLIEHGFVGAKVQKTCLDRLATECDVQTTQFKSRSRRTKAAGLHVDFQPAVQWITDGGEE